MSSITSPVRIFYPKPSAKILKGIYCVIHPFDKTAHSSDLYKIFSLDPNNQDWIHLPHGPFHSEREFQYWMDHNCLSKDALFFTVCNADLKPIGMFSFIKIEPQHGKLELGHVHFSSELKQTTAATEAFYLALRFVFADLGYRRLEWKCHNDNEQSKRCALRLGFIFEGVFRQHWIIKGQNRDTAWYSIIDQEWPNLKNKFEAWLHHSNFKPNGQQIKKLNEIAYSAGLAAL